MHKPSILTLCYTLARLDHKVRVIKSEVMLADRLVSITYRHGDLTTHAYAMERGDNARRMVQRLRKLRARVYAQYVACQS